MVKFILPVEVLPLRSLVLRNGKPLNECVFDGDTAKNTFHLGFIVNGKIETIASFMRNDFLQHVGKGYQLRGMATQPNLAGRGFATALINFAVENLKKNNIEYLWCNARLSAAPFYTKLGFKIESDEFDVPGIGLHYLMKLNLKK